MSRLTDRTGMSKNTVLRMREELQKNGLLLVEERGANKASLYTLVSVAQVLKVGYKERPLLEINDESASQGETQNKKVRPKLKRIIGSASQSASQSVSQSVSHSGSLYRHRQRHITTTVTNKSKLLMEEKAVTDGKRYFGTELTEEEIQQGHENEKANLALESVVNEVFTYLASCSITMESSYSKRRIEGFLKAGYSKDEMIHAITEAADSNVMNWRYIKTVLENERKESSQTFRLSTDGRSYEE